MRSLLLVSLLFLLAGCAQTIPEKLGLAGPVSCRGIYKLIDDYGNLKKFNQYEREGQCWTDNVALTQFEKTEEKWNKNHVTCTPQPSFVSRTLVLAGNFYTYSDGKGLLDLDASTGVFRRLILGEDVNGRPTFTKLQGCFYTRTGAGVDIAYGKQLLLDTTISKVVSSQYTDIAEIFTYTELGSDVNMVRYDESADWNYRFCPELSTPWSFCAKLRDGNDMYYPVLSAADQTAMLNEALLIRKTFNYTAMSKSSFDSQWKNVELTRTEKMLEDLKYHVIHTVDTPRFIDQAWRDYVMGTRPTMPDTSSTRMPLVCYPGFQNITLANGSTGRTYGEICYENGVYSFQ